MGPKPTENGESETHLGPHCTAFKEFLSNSSEIKSDRHANSSRTKKAREKLLKLSTEQFSELSTDVFDELNRRSDKSPEKPGYLLANDQFHPKRNQARRKLASLPSSRFKDLVTDMLYEVERRGLDTEKPTDPDASNDHSTAHIGIQAGTVIPTKSTLAWSSDEEDEDISERKVEKPKPVLPKAISNSNSNIQHSSQQNSSQSRSIQPHHKVTNSDASNDFAVESPQARSHNRNISEHSYLPPSKRKSVDDRKDREIELLLAEGNKMDKTITLHEQTIETLRADLRKLELEKSELLRSNEDNRSKVFLLERELAGNKGLLDLLRNEQNSKSVGSESKVLELQQEISKLNFTISNLEREKSAVENSYIKLKDDYEKANGEYKSILDDYKVLQEKYNSVLLSEEEVRNEVNDERKKNVTKIKKLETENRSLLDQLEASKAQLESQKVKQFALSRGLPSELNSKDSLSEIGKIEDRLEKVKNKNINDDNESVEGLKLQILDWQKRYQDLRSESLKQSMTSGANETLLSSLTIKPTDLSENSMEQFVDPGGLISLKSIVDLNSLISSFLLIINDDNLSTDLLFETITKITIIAGNIASEGETINNGEYSALIKASVSHAITSTRFYAVHGRTLPKLVVETAISEIAFSVCNLVSSAKAHKAGGNGFTTLIGDVPSKGQRSLNAGDSFGEDANGSEESIPNVRPLRMAKKNGQNLSPIITTKRENPFTTNFSLSPNLIAMSAPKFSSFGANNDHKNSFGVSSNHESNNLKNSPQLDSKSGQNHTNGPGLTSNSSKFNDSGQEAKGIFNTLNLSKSSNKVTDLDFEAEPTMNELSPNFISKSVSEKSSASPAARSYEKTESERGTDGVASNLNYTNGNNLKDAVDATYSATLENHVDSFATLSKSTELNRSSSTSSNTGFAEKAEQGTHNKNTDYAHNDYGRKLAENGNLQSSKDDGIKNNKFESKNIVKKSIINSFDNNQNSKNSSTHDISNLSQDTKERDQREQQSVSQLNSLLNRQENGQESGQGSDLVNGLFNSQENGQVHDKKDGQAIHKENGHVTDQENGQVHDKKDGQAIRKENGHVTDQENGQSGHQKDDQENGQAINQEYSQKNGQVNGQINYQSSEQVNGERNGQESDQQLQQVVQDSDLLLTKDIIPEKSLDQKKDSYASLKNDSSLRLSNQSTPKKGSISSLKDKFNKDASKDGYERPVTRNMPTSKGSILSRVRQLEDSLNHSSPNSSPHNSPNPVKPLSDIMVLKFGGRSVSGNLKKEDSRNSLDNKTTEINGNSSSNSSFSGSPRAHKTKNEPIPQVSSNRNITPLKIITQKPNTEVFSSNDNMPSPLQETRKTDRTAEFDINAFDIADPDNTLAELLLYLEHQTVEVISTIQTLLSAIKTPDSTTGTLKEGAKAIGEVVGQMFDATSVSMAQSRNVQLREHGRWVVQSLADCGRRMDMLCSNDKSDDDDYADKHFKQRLAGIAFDIAKCTKELVKTVEEASIKEEIAVIDARLSRSRVEA